MLCTFIIFRWARSASTKFEGASRGDSINSSSDSCQTAQVRTDRLFRMSRFIHICILFYFFFFLRIVLYVFFFLVSVSFRVIVNVFVDTKRTLLRVRTRESDEFTNHVRTLRKSYARARAVLTHAYTPIYTHTHKCI